MKEQSIYKNSFIKKNKNLIIVKNTLLLPNNYLLCTVLFISN